MQKKSLMSFYLCKNDVFKIYFLFLFNMRKKKQKAQGTLETLLLFGGAILLAAIVISVVIGISSNSKQAAEKHTNVAISMSDTVIPAILYSVACIDTTCTVFFQDFGNGTNELVIDNDADNRTEIIDKQTTIAAPLALGKHAAYILTTINGGANKSNIYRWDVTDTQHTASIQTPTASPAGTNFENTIDVSLSCITEETTIHYTTNGDAPDCSDVQYTSTLTFTSTTTLKAIACEGENQSNIVTEIYTLIGTNPETPIAVPGTGIISPSTFIELSTVTPGAKILYAINDDPKNGKPYEGPIEIKEDLRLYAIAELGGVFSGVLEADYKIGVDVLVPTAEPTSIEFENKLEIKLSSTEGAEIFYTIDGSIPTADSTIYKEPLMITENTTLKAVAIFKETSSGIMTEKYTKK